MHQNKAKFKSKFCQWAQSNLPSTSIDKFTHSLNEVLIKHIPDCDNRVQIMIRDLASSEKLNVSYISNEVLISPTYKQERLIVGVLMPSWDKGLRSYCKDEYVYSAISWFFYYASQYVARSRMVDVMSGLNMVYGRSCDFRGSRILRINTLNSELVRNEFILAVMKETKTGFRYVKGARERILMFWIEKINTLDPFIHRMFFNYINSCKLQDGQFDEEAITSLDKTVDVIRQYARDRMNINGAHNQRELTLNAFEMTEYEKGLLARLYDLRNFFGGHPSMSKWWDFSEIFERDIESIFEVVRRLIYKTVMHENANRVVNKNPVSWSEWFEEHAMMLWETVWFEKINKYIR